ncbi:MAG: response regulator [Patescibacteria group bacterium]|nr:response regulator [Patescibacteria group bacterium]
MIHKGANLAGITDQELYSVDMLHNLHILYAEDENTLREQLSSNLLMMNMTSESNLHKAEDGKEALEIFQKQHIDILITDINMPEVDGIQLIEEVWKSRPDILIIVTSAYGDVSSDIREKENLIKFVPKPLNFDNLERILLYYAWILFDRKYRERVQSSQVIEKLTARLNIANKENSDLRQRNQELEEKIEELTLLLQHGEGDED